MKTPWCIAGLAFLSNGPRVAHCHQVPNQNALDHWHARPLFHILVDKGADFQDTPLLLPRFADSTLQCLVVKSCSPQIFYLQFYLMPLR